MVNVSNKVVYWHRELPPLDAEVIGEHTLEATSMHVPGTLAHRVPRRGGKVLVDAEGCEGGWIGSIPDTILFVVKPGQSRTQFLSDDHLYPTQINSGPGWTRVFHARRFRGR